MISGTPKPRDTSLTGPLFPKLQATSRALRP
jgi:hypothetical protein